MRVVFAPRAERQITALHSFIADAGGEQRADSYIGRIVAFCKGLSTFPRRGTPRDDIVPGLRIAGVERRTTIAFTVSGNIVLIEGIFYGGQNFESAFDRD